MYSFTTSGSEDEDLEDEDEELEAEAAADAVVAADEVTVRRGASKSSTL
jgi:hypothetical protein